MDFVKKFQKIEQTELPKYYEYYGEECAPDAETILFLAGVGCGAVLFRDSALEKFYPKYKILLINNPGLGGTTCPMMPSVEAIAGMVGEVLDTLEIEKCHIVSHSMGGYVAQRLTLNYPDRISRMVLMSTSYGGPQNKKDIQRLTKEVGMDIFEFKKSLKTGGDKAIRFTMSPNFPDLEPETYKEFVKFYSATRPDESIIQKHFWCGSRFDNYRDAHKIETPCLVIHGDKDRLISVNGGRRLASQLPNNRYLELADCGHFPFIERHTMYEIIKAFIEGDETMGEHKSQDPVPESHGWFDWLTH